jgi:hypothetical protein
MDNKDLEKQKKLEDDSLLYLIRHVAKEWDLGTWEDTTAVYNYLATKTRSQDGVTSRYKSLERDCVAKKAFEQEFKQESWMILASEVKKLLREGVPCVRRASLDEKPSWFPKQKDILPSNEHPATSATIEHGMWEPTPTYNIFPSSMIDSFSSITAACELDPYTNTLPDASSHLPGQHDFDSFCSVPDLVASGATTPETHFAATASVSTATNMLDDMVTNAFNYTINYTNTSAFGNDFMATQPFDGIDGTVSMFGYTAPEIPYYNATNTYGYTPTNTPFSMPTDTLDLTAMGLRGDTAAGGFNGTASRFMESTPMFPLKQGTINAADSPTLGAYHAGRSDLLAQNASHWFLEDEMQPSLCYPSKCAGRLS